MDSAHQEQSSTELPPASSGDGGASAREERRDSALRLLSRLAGGLAHEIKNPLSTMAINLALLQEEWERAAQARNPSSPEPTPREQRSLKRIRTLQREVERLEQVLEQFLRFAKGGEIDRKPEDIGRIVRELLEFVEPENAQAGIRAHTDLAVGLPLVLADEAQVKQALLNILINARQAMPEGGELLVRVRRAGKDVEITITDTGIGMTAEQFERCFEPYWSDKRGGTGLGLSTSRRIVEQHGGTIQVLSERGRGTAFTIFLPLAVEIPRPGAEGLAEATRDPHGDTRDPRRDTRDPRRDAEAGHSARVAPADAKEPGPA